MSMKCCMKFSNRKFFSKYCVFFFFLKRPLYIDPIFENFTSNCSLCNACKSHYLNLTQFFDKLGDEKSLCMDIVDLVNLFSIYVCFKNLVIQFIFTYFRIIIHVFLGLKATNVTTEILMNNMCLLLALLRV